MEIRVISSEISYKVFSFIPQLPSPIQNKPFYHKLTLETPVFIFFLFLPFVWGGGVICCREKPCNPREGTT